MSRFRTALLGALLWCGVVAVVATLVWVVISRAGQGVVPVTQPQADVTGSLPVPGDENRRALRTNPGVTLAPRPSRSTAPPSSGTTTPVTPPSSPPPTPRSSAPTTPTVQRRSWSGAAGHRVAECRGRSAELVSAFPNAGWRYAIGSRGPAQVRVRFTRTSGDDTSVAVDARCVAGVPHFWLPGNDGGGDD
jgi:hypothetical protein